MNQTGHWGSLAVSWLGCTSLIKINILPHLLYHISMIPVLTINLNGWISSFTCNKCRPKLKIIVLQLPGGLDIITYQLCAQMNYIHDGIVSDLVSTYVGIDACLSTDMPAFPLISTDGLTLRNLKPLG